MVGWRTVEGVKEPSRGVQAVEWGGGRGCGLEVVLSDCGLNYVD